MKRYILFSWQGYESNDWQLGFSDSFDDIESAKFAATNCSNEYVQIIDTQPDQPVIVAQGERKYDEKRKRWVKWDEPPNVSQ